MLDAQPPRGNVVDGDVGLVVVVEPIEPFASVVVVDPDFGIVVVVVDVVVVVVGGGTGWNPGIGGFLHTCIAFGMDGCFSPGRPEPKAVSTFSVILTTGAIGQLPRNDGHGDPSAATQRLVPVEKTPAPLGVV